MRASDNRTRIITYISGHRTRHGDTTDRDSRTRSANEAQNELDRFLQRLKYDNFKFNFIQYFIIYINFNFKLNK